MKILVITLPDSIQRQDNIKEQLGKYNMSFDFVYGIDGRKLTDNEINDLYDSNKAKIYGKELDFTQIGCSYSHKLAYKKIIDERIERAVILEDGISLLPDFFKIISLLNNIKINGTVIKLDRCYSTQQNNDNYIRSNFTPWHRIKLTDDYYVGQPSNDPYLTGAYYIDLSAANTIYSLMPKIFLIPDGWYFFRKKIKLRMINFALAYRDRGKIPSIMYPHVISSTSKKRKSFFTKMTNKIKHKFRCLLLLFK